MLSDMLMQLVSTYHHEIGMGLIGLMGGTVRVLAAIAGKEQMPPSLVAATLICAAIIPAIGGDFLQDWMNLGAKATGLFCFILGGVAIKVVLKVMQKAQEVEIPWPSSGKQEGK
ncbi:hypothetical protein ACSBOB_20205 [Mesorhizobium sp. ASY16-5R]|uniref:hypothetical protein n=1 Tax=Mesorhizobium sp. ASY16-5R TaxID=3445772 RepID=UPI003FA0BC3B